MCPTKNNLCRALLPALLVCLAAAGAGPAFAGDVSGSGATLSGTGSSAAVHGSQLSSGRDAVSRLDSGRSSIIREREALEAELDILAGEIVELKSRSSRGLRAEAELNRRLQRSRDLSLQIDQLARTEEEATAALIFAASRLLESYDAETNAIRVELERMASVEGGQEKSDVRAALERITLLESERGAVTEGMFRLERDRRGAEGRSALLLDTTAHTDDPDELRARADILRDTKDRLVRRLDELDRKARTARRQRALEREMDGFLAESRLFDEGDRAAARLVSSGSEGAPVSGGSLVPSRGADLEAGAPSDDFDAAPPEVGGEPGEDPTWDGDRNDSSPAIGAEPIESPSFEGPTGGGAEVSQMDRITTRAEASAALDALLSHGGGSSPEEIEAYREEIERLISRLERRADVLDRRAALLEASR